jgi:hypothetical protein
MSALITVDYSGPSKDEEYARVTVSGFRRHFEGCLRRPRWPRGGGLAVAPECVDPDRILTTSFDQPASHG